MTSIKVKFRPSTVDGKEGTVYYQIIHERKARQIVTEIRLNRRDWDSRRSAIAGGAPGLDEEEDRIMHDTDLLSRIVGDLDRRPGGYEADDVVAEFRRISRRLSAVGHMETLIDTFRRGDRIRTAETYESALKSFMAFRGGKDIMLDAVDSVLIEKYESWLKKRGNTPNTTSFYMRILRAAYNRAVDENLIVQGRPFRHVYTGIGRTVKRALPIQVIRRMRSLVLRDPRASYARDMFLLSFYLRGMSFVDMAFLRKSDLRYGYVLYRRRKTGRLLKIEWTGEMQEIVNRYPANPTRYLLPILTRDFDDGRKAYKNILARINRGLKLVTAVAGVDFPLTLYCARHSWASAARAKGVPVSVISQGMGHESEQTTLIYLASLDSSVVDRANRLLINAVR